MKYIITTMTALILSSSLFAAEMTQTEIENYIIQIAKELRRDLWVAGHAEVDSRHQL